MSKPRWCLLAIIAVLLAVLPAPPAAAAPATVAPGAAAPAGDPIEDPIPEDPVASRLALTLKEYAAFPKSEPVPPPTDPRLMRQARINFLGELPDGSGRKFTPDLNGKLYLVEDGQPREYLDVGAVFAPAFFSGRGLGQGFGFAAFHPDFQRNGKFYTVHTELASATTAIPDLTPQPDTRFHGIVTEWTADDPSADTFRGTRREVLRLGFAGQIHGIQQIDFNPNAERGDRDHGLLYVAAGDGGQGAGNDDPQNPAIPHGKILRIDPEGDDSANGRYGIPPDNPFVGEPGVLGEIYASGMRDPHRFSWDTGGRERMYLGHIGEHAIEAVYDVRAGDNLGWSEREGPYLYDKQATDPCDRLYPLPEDDETFGYTYPVAAYDHNPPPDWNCTSDVGRAISGGFVYRGDDVPELRGKYVFGDIVDGRVFYTEAREMRRGSARLATIHELRILDGAGERTTMAELAGDARVDLRFGTDHDGELYLLAKANGKIWQVTGARTLPHPADVHPSLRRDLAAYYDFENPVTGDPAREQDQGFSGTNIDLVNGKAAMRVADGAYPASATSLQLRQVDPAAAGNDDWKAGRYSATGVPTLNAFNEVRGTTVMGWFKMTGRNPSPDTNTADPDDLYGAIGLAGVLSGDSDGHGVRALLELINVDGELHVVALGRRIDGSRSQTFAASEDWRTLLPPDEWVFLAATFDFDEGTMALYRNGEPLDGFYTVAGDPWGVGGPGPHRTSATDPRGLKIGGSFPQDNREANPCDCRMDSLMFLDRSVSPGDVRRQYARATAQP